MRSKACDSSRWFNSADGGSIPPLTTKFSIYAGLAHWLRTGFPSQPNEFDSRIPLHLKKECFGVVVAQLAEPWIVIPVVASSSLVSHPKAFSISGPCAQLVRAPACHAGGRRFKSGVDRQNRYATVAQQVEHWTFNPGVAGSKPARCTNLPV
jgi:hypothetical protein